MPPNVENLIALPPGGRLGEYRIERCLGSGGFGITYSAIDENLDRRVAIKEYLPKSLAIRDANDRVTVATAEDEADFRWGLDRFLDEARALAHFDHANIVGVKRFLEAHGTGYIVMEYVDGEPLSEILKCKLTLTEPEIREHVLPLAAGLAEIHAAGLLHRDIKPSNIVVGADGVPVLIDFGSARLAVNAKSQSLTAVVTPGYAPLEQYSAKGRQLPATDIYALGAVLYRCVTGVTPRDATERALEDRLAPVAEAADGVYSDGLLTAIHAALAMQVDDRPNDIAEFLNLVSTGDNECAIAKAFDIAMKAYVQGQYELALKKLGRLAALGHARAQYNLACMYAIGNGVPQDHARAFQWYSRAADLGDADAQFKLGLTFANGGLVPQDLTQAVGWYKRAAEQGHAYAQHYLSYLHSFDSGVSQVNGDPVPLREARTVTDAFSGGLPHRYAHSTEWCIQAAEQGNPDAQCELGVMHYFGVGVPEDQARAIRWFTRAAEQGHVDAQRYRAAAQGDIDAQRELGTMYQWGDPGAPEDHVQAVHWFARAAEQGDASAQQYMERVQDVKQHAQAAEQEDAEAQYELGNRYDIGDGAPQDPAEAAKWYTRAAGHGHVGAQLKLGEMYRSGWGVPEDPAQAAQWFIRSAEQGNAKAQLMLGGMYYLGEGVPKDPAQAARWFTRSAEQGNPEAQYRLGDMYTNGTGVRADNVQAYAWTNLAVGRVFRFDLCGQAPAKVRHENDLAARLRDKITENLSAAELAAAKELSDDLEARIQSCR